MAFIRKKKIKGHTYAYRVESYRDQETRKPRQRVLEYLGKVNDAASDDVPSESATNHGGGALQLAPGTLVFAKGGIGRVKEPHATLPDRVWVTRLDHSTSCYSLEQLVVLVDES